MAPKFDPATAGLHDRLTEADLPHVLSEHGLNLSSQQLQVLKDIVKYAKIPVDAAKVLQYAEIIAEGFLALKFVSIGFEMLRPFLVLLDIAAAWARAEKLVALHGFSYGITAWAFNDPHPPISPKLLLDMRGGPTGQRFPITPERQMRAINAWSQGVDAAYRLMEMEVNRSKYLKPVHQEFMQGIGGGSRAELCRRIMKGLEPEVEESLLRHWRSRYRTEYPG